MHSFRIFDSHLHIIDPRFPLIANQGYLPDYFTANDYLHIMAPYNLAGGVVVSGSFQGFDQDFLISALKYLGPGFAGVTQLPVTVTNDEILRLHQYGIRGIRFNFKRGSTENIKHLTSLAARVHETAGWHIELYIDSTRLSELDSVIRDLPRVSIDHLGLCTAGFDQLLDLVEYGVQVKATGFGRVDFDVARALKTIYAVNPSALMFGTDLPSTRAPRPFRHEDYLLIIEALDEEGARRVLCENAQNFYRISAEVDNTLNIIE